MSVKNLIFLLLVVFSGYFYMTYMGGTDGELVSDLLITSEKNQKILDVEFNGAVRYVGHFPEKAGDILQIKFRTITFSGAKDNYSLVEKLQLSGQTQKDYIEDIRYEGNVPGAPLLIVRFTQPVTFSVSESNGLRSINVNYQLL